MSAPDPLEHSTLHQLLVRSNQLQQVPVPLVALILVALAGLVYAAWPAPDAGIAAAGLLATSCFNWAMLAALPATGRSFGPDKPSALALALLNTLLLLPLAALNAPVWAALLLLGIIAALAVYATWIEPFRLGVTRQHFRAPGLRADTPPLRLLQIGDIHVERISPRERALNRLVADLAPDLIVFTGDFVNLSNTHDPDSERDIRAVIGEWRAPLGVYAVSGTPLVEPLDRVKAFVADIDHITPLFNAWTTVETPGGPLHILGLIVTHDMAKDRANLARMMVDAPDGPRLLLMHPPDIAPEADAAGIDLYLCGHTHGGQIRLPLIGAPFSSSHLGNQFIMGRYELGRTTLYTARGVGLEGLGAPRARFLCPPEIVLWEITGAG